MDEPSQLAQGGEPQGQKEVSPPAMELSFHLKPSVATWLLIKKNISQRRPDDPPLATLQAISSAADDRHAGLDDASASGPRPFSLKPSVGTWLQPRVSAGEPQEPAELASQTHAAPPAESAASGAGQSTATVVEIAAATVPAVPEPATTDALFPVDAAELDGGAAVAAASMPTAVTPALGANGGAAAPTSPLSGRTSTAPVVPLPPSSSSPPVISLASLQAASLTTLPAKAAAGTDAGADQGAAQKVSQRGAGAQGSSAAAAAKECSASVASDAAGSEQDACAEAGPGQAFRVPPGPGIPVVVGKVAEERQPRSIISPHGGVLSTRPTSSLVRFRVQLPDGYPQLQYRMSMHVNDRAEFGWAAKHGEIAEGVLEHDRGGGEWLRLKDDHFLPVRMCDPSGNDVQVLHRLPDDLRLPEDEPPASRARRAAPKSPSLEPKIEQWLSSSFFCGWCSSAPHVSNADIRVL